MRSELKETNRSGEWVPVVEPILVLAGAGLSDCVSDGRSDCMPGFGTFLLELGTLAVGVPLWLILACWATVSIAGAAMPRGRRRSWLVAIWAVPIAGAVAWLINARSGGARAVTVAEPENFEEN